MSVTVKLKVELSTSRDPGVSGCVGRMERVHRSGGGERSAREARSCWVLARGTVIRVGGDVAGHEAIGCAVYETCLDRRDGRCFLMDGFSLVSRFECEREGRWASRPRRGGSSLISHGKTRVLAACPSSSDPMIQ